MIIGILLGLSLGIFLSSLILSLLKFSGIVAPLIITGSVIGSKNITSYLLVLIVLSLISTLYFIRVIRNNHRSNF